MDKELNTRDIPLEAYKRLEQTNFIEEKNGTLRFKGRRANIVDAVVGMQKRGITAAELASELSLPIAAIEEAVTYLTDWPQLITEHYNKMKQLADASSSR